MELVILAAGIGSRFGGLKQIEPMDEYGNFIIDYSIYDAIEAGFDTVTFIIKKEFLIDFKNTIGKGIKGKIKIKYAFQELLDIPSAFNYFKDRQKPWGTAHAIRAIRNIVNNHFAIINADDYYGKESYKVAAKYLKELSKDDTGKYANVVYKVKNTLTENGSVKRGVCFKDDENQLTKMIESSIIKNDEGIIIATTLEKNECFEIDENQLVSMNMFVFTKDILDHLNDKFLIFLEENKENMSNCEFLIPTVINELIHEGKANLKLLPTTSKWYGVTYLNDKNKVVNALKEKVNEGLYIKGLWK